MEPVAVIALVFGIIIGIVLLDLFLGFFIIHFANYVKFMRKNNSKNASNNTPEFSFQLDDNWFFQPGYFQYLTINSFENKEISAYFHLEEKSHLYIVFAHGFCGTPWEKAKALHDLYNIYHCNIVAIEQRGQTNSKIKYCSMGYKEGRDMVSWTNYIVNLDKSAQIVVYGESMGAATVLYGVGYGYNKNVMCAIADCGYSSISKVYDYTAQQYVPKIISKFGVFGTVMAWFIFFRMRVVKYSPLKSIKEKSLPICFIHGNKDQIVPYECFEIFKNNINKETKAVFESFDGATHACSYYVDRERYLNIVSSFIDNNGK